MAQMIAFSMKHMAILKRRGSGIIDKKVIIRRKPDPNHLHQKMMM